VNPDGYFQEAQVKLRPVDFSADGVFMCDLDQTPEFDPAEPEPIPEEHFDQSRGA